MNNILEFSKVLRYYKGIDKKPIIILEDVSFQIKKGETVGLIGPSGSGKSTLLHLAALLEAPDAGEVKIAGRETSLMKDREKTSLRASKIGLVYQFHGLLPEFSALENVMIPQHFDTKSKKECFEKTARDLLDQVGLSHRLSHRSGELSGGEQQRVALARALVNEPDLLLADEPTGNLDPETGATVMDVLCRIALEKNIALMIATHNSNLAKKMQRVVMLSNRQLVACQLG